MPKGKTLLQEMQRGLKGYGPNRTMWDRYNRNLINNKRLAENQRWSNPGPWETGEISSPIYDTKGTWADNGRRFIFTDDGSGYPASSKYSVDRKTGRAYFYDPVADNWSTWRSKNPTEDINSFKTNGFDEQVMQNPQLPMSFIEDGVEPPYWLDELENRDMKFMVNESAIKDYLSNMYGVDSKTLGNIKTMRDLDDWALENWGDYYDMSEL